MISTFRCWPCAIATLLGTSSRTNLAVPCSNGQLSCQYTFSATFNWWFGPSELWQRIYMMRFVAWCAAAHRCYMRTSSS